jgi:hypothetical protein
MFKLSTETRLYVFDKVIGASILATTTKYLPFRFTITKLILMLQLELLRAWLTDEDFYEYHYELYLTVYELSDSAFVRNE